MRFAGEAGGLRSPHAARTGHDAPSSLRVADDPRPILHHGFQAAKETILAELFNNQTLIVVTGANGSGKTLLLREVGRILRSSGWNVEVGLERRRMLVGADHSQPQGGVPTAIMIDGPGEIAPGHIGQILRSEDVAIVMALPAGTDLRFPSSAPIRLAALTPGESALYVGAWLSQAGHRAELVGGAPLARLIGLSQGIPRVLSSFLTELVGRASLQAAAEVSTADIDRAASRLGVSNDAGAVELAGPRYASGMVVEVDACFVEGSAQPGPARTVGGFKPHGRSGFDRVGFANGALAGLLGGVGLVLLGLLVFDWLPSSSDQGDVVGREGASAPAVANRSTADGDPLRSLPSEVTPER